MRFVILLLLLLLPVSALAQMREVYSPGDGYLNLRSGPGSSYAIIREMLNGEQVRVIGSDGNWLNVEAADGRIGWAFGDYLVAPRMTGTAQTREVYSPRDGYLNLRAGPGTSHAIIREMLNGERVRILSHDGDWRRVEAADGRIGWAHGDYLVAPRGVSAGFFAPGTCAMQVLSRPRLTDLRGPIMARDYGGTVRVYEGRSGWYALTLELLDQRQADSVIRDLVARGLVPADTFCHDGRNYVREISEAEVFRDRLPSADPAPLAPAPSCSPAYVEQEVAACYYLAFGPQFCAAAAREAVIPGEETYFQRVTIAAGCEVAIRSTLARHYVPEDLVVTAFEELVGAGCEQINSDFLSALVIGLPSCIGLAAMWAERLDSAAACADRIVRQCN